MHWAHRGKRNESVILFGVKRIYFSARIHERLFLALAEQRDEPRGESTTGETKLGIF